MNDRQRGSAREIRPPEGLDRQHQEGPRAPATEEIGCGIRTDLPAAECFPLETVFPEVAARPRSGVFEILSSEHWRVGIGSVPCEGDPESAVRHLYRDLFLAAEGMNVCRIWNFVPHINLRTPSGLECYQAFSRARSLAFEKQWGPDFRARLPAASAVGNLSERLVVRFAASSRRPTHWENPRQIPAYHYPETYGPRPPSFSRATLVPSNGGTDVFVSGTSAVVGHETVAPKDTKRQLECTLENLRALSQECGLGEDLGAGRARLRQFSVYLRNPQEQSWIVPLLEERLFKKGDLVSVAQADICRCELNIEIEATLRGVRPR